jgi:hypothetical protein
MAWVLIDDNFPLHPKAVQAGPAAAYLFVCGLCYCRKHHTGGFIPRQAISMLGLTTNPRRMVDALVRVGLWDIDADGWRVHGYEGMYADEEDKAMKEVVSQQRRDAGRKGGLRSGEIRVAKTHGASHGASSTGGSGLGECSSILLEEKKREADFANFWAAYPRKDGKQAAKAEWLKLRPSDEIQKQIAADLERRGRSSQWLKDGGQFIPHPRTYLHQRRWEDGFEERPRLAERTINVIKGFEDVRKADIA